MRPRVLLVLGHGRDASLCRHLFEFVRAGLEAQGAELREHDLLADGFDPVLRLRSDQAHAEEVAPEEDALVARYQADVRWADGFVFVHPVWWFAPPAILKGWVDRVLADGVALVHGSEPPQGSLTGRSALVVQTFGAPQAVDRLLMRRISTRFWTTAVGFSVGIRDITPLALYQAADLSPQRLKRFERRLTRATTRLVERARERSRSSS